MALMQRRHRRQNQPDSLLSLMLVGLLVMVVVAAARFHQLGWLSGRPASAQSGAAGDWLMFGYDAARDSVNPHESLISRATAGRLHRLWTARLPQIADSTPILLHNLLLPDGTQHDVLYLTTKAGSLMALDAATGARLWATTPRSQNPKYTTASPVADPSGSVIYSYGLDGKVHQYQAATGQEITGNGWPVLVTTMPQSEKGSSALNIANGYLYITTAGFDGDAPPYQGHVVVVDLFEGSVHVFNTLCSNQTHLLAPDACPENQSGIWGRAGAVVDPLTSHIFVATGNGPYTANQGGHDWGDSVLELSANGESLLDSYTPTDFAALSPQDQDVGSTSPALLPMIPASRTPYLLVQASKDSMLRLLNRQNLSGQGGPGHLGGELQELDAPDHCPVLAQPVVWTDPASGAVWVFVANSCAISGYRVLTSARGVTSLRQAWSVGASATSPVIADGVLFAATSHALLALDPRTGQRLWSSAQSGAGGSIDAIHWESPIVINGRVYCSDEAGQLTAYSL